MKAKKFSVKLIKYEMLNILGNPFADFFGVVFPIMMLFIITQGVIKSQVPASAYAEVCTSIFISMSLIIPMAIILLGYAATYSQELEKEIPLRMMLFGYSEKVMILAKVIAQVVVMTMALLVYSVVGVIGLELETPKPGAVFMLIVFQYLLGVIFFGIAYGVASIIRKFGPTYALMMALYFGVMILSGMMGIQVDDLPKVLQGAASLMPTAHIANDYIDVWMGRRYNFASLLQAFLFMGAAAGIILVMHGYRNRREKR